MQEWFRVTDAYARLGFRDPNALRRWIRKGKKQKWLKLGVHIKPLIPTSKRITWMVHVSNCNQVGAKKLL